MKHRRTVKRLGAREGCVKQPASLPLYPSVELSAEAGATDVERAYEEEGARLYYALLGYTASADVAAEAVAETFARAMRERGIRDLRAWLWKVAFRVASAEMKRRGRHEPLTDEAMPPPEPIGLIVALAEISERQRAAIVLHYYAGYSLDEIASILGIRKGTVGVHLHRGRQRLRELLEVHDG
jgi:RNA polymerase sigma-70 factor (ECF subfamily)